MPDSICTVTDCSRLRECQGMCTKHYARWKRTGTTDLRGPEYYFWQKVAIGGPDDCWEWQGEITKWGYGMFRGERAHRFSARLAGMDIEGRFVCHSCDYKLCVNNLRHLYPGTHDDNMADAVERKRMLRGEAHPLAKLTAVDIPEIFHLSEAGLSYLLISERFGVAESTISNVIHRKTWRHVQEVP